MAYDDLIERYAAEYGVPATYLRALIARESGENPEAKNPNSSAGGLGQFIDDTWLSILRRFPEYSSPRVHNDASLLALKRNPDLNIRATAALTQENAAALAAALGRDPTPNDLYAAHFLGPEDAINVLTANPDDPFTEGFVRPASIKANPTIFSGVGTVGDLLDRLRLPGSPPRGETAEELIARLATPQPPPTQRMRPPPRRTTPNTAPPSGGEQSVWDSIADIFAPGESGEPSFAESLFQQQPPPQPVIFPFQPRSPQFQGFRLRVLGGITPFGDSEDADV